jgi:hypothetical protein
MSEQDRFILVYQSSAPMVLMEMKHYHCGMVKLSKPGQEVTVSAKERNHLLKHENQIFRDKVQEVN